MTELKTDNQVNQIIYSTRLSWIIFFWPVLSFFLVSFIYFYVSALHDFSLFLIAFSVLWIGMTWVNYYFSSIVIKRKQIFLRTGLIVRKTVDIPFSKIESIDIRQSILGSILRYGALIITGTGGTRHLINYIDKPLTCRRYIEQLMNEHA